MLFESSDCKQILLCSNLCFHSLQQNGKGRIAKKTKTNKNTPKRKKPQEVSFWGFFVNTFINIKATDSSRSQGMIQVFFFIWWILDNYFNKSVCLVVYHTLLDSVLLECNRKCSACKAIEEQSFCLWASGKDSFCNCKFQPKTSSGVFNSTQIRKLILWIC